MKRIITTKQVGFTLIELLVAMTLGLFLMTGVISAFLSAKQSYAQQDALGQMQENARFSLEMLARETRMAGFGGCSGDISVANTLDSGYTGSATSFSDGLIGYLGDTTNSTFPTSFKASSAVGTDAIIIHTVDSDNSLVVDDSHQPNSANIPFTTSNSTLQIGDIVVLVDSTCSNMAIYANTGPSNTSNNAQKSIHNTGNISGETYKNCDNALKGNFTCSDTSGALELAYTAGSFAYKIESFAYFIGAPTANATSGIPSLYRKDVSGTSTANAASAEEVVEGVTDLEIFYGLKSGNNVQYLKANGISAADWINVQSVRYNVTVQSLTSVSGSPVSKTFTTTVKLRNRG